MSAPSSQKNNQQGTAKYANSNLNPVFAKPSQSATAPGAGGTLTRNGMLVLSKVGRAPRHITRKRSANDLHC